MMASVSAPCTNHLPVDLRLPPAALLFQLQQPPTSTTSIIGASSTTLLSPMRCERRLHQRRGCARRLVASAATTEPPSAEKEKSVVGDMERGSLSEESGRADGQLAARWREIHGRGDWEGLLDPIDTVLRGELIRYGEFAQACYDAFDYDRFSRYSGSSRYPPPTFFRDVGLDGVGYEVTRYLYATSNARLPNFVTARTKHHHRSGCDDPDARLWSETASFIGFVAVSTDEETARIGRRDVAVAWRGTVTRLEWVADLTAAPRPVASFGIPCPDPGAKVESGFAELYTGKDAACRWCRYSSREQVLAEVRKLVELYHGRGEEVSVTVTGHSLGSALATLSAFDVTETGANVSPAGPDGRKRKAAPVCVFSFSGPRLGNTRFKVRLERELGVKVLRVVNVHDMVPTVPGVFYFLNERSFPEAALRLIDDLGLGAVYVHVGVELALDHRASPYLKADTLDLASFHNLEAHLHLLDGYRGRDREFRLGGRDPALVNKASDFLRDEHMVPPVWRQDENKGMVRAEDGRWVLPPRHREVHDHPEDTDHHLRQLGLAAN